jgi:hypothetical protein
LFVGYLDRLIVHAKPLHSFSEQAKGCGDLDESSVDQACVHGRLLVATRVGHNMGYDGRPCVDWRWDCIVCSPGGALLHEFSILLVFEDYNDRVAVKYFGRNATDLSIGDVELDVFD